MLRSMARVISANNSVVPVAGILQRHHKTLTPYTIEIDFMNLASVLAMKKKNVSIIRLGLYHFSVSVTNFFCSISKKSFNCFENLHISRARVTGFIATQTLCVQTIFFAFKAKTKIPPANCRPVLADSLVFESGVIPLNYVYATKFPKAI